MLVGVANADAWFNLPGTCAPPAEPLWPNPWRGFLATAMLGRLGQPVLLF